MSGRMSTSHTVPAAVAACEAGDDDVKEGDDAVDDGCEDHANAVDNGHQAVADGAEDGFDLGKN
jgi:hypothetical protein